MIERRRKYWAPYVLVKKGGPPATHYPVIKIGCVEIEAPEEQADSAYFTHLAKEKLERDLQTKHKNEIKEGYYIPPIDRVYHKKEDVRKIIESKVEKNRLLEYWGKKTQELIEYVCAREVC